MHHKIRFLCSKVPTTISQHSLYNTVACNAVLAALLQQCLLHTLSLKCACWTSRCRGFRKTLSGVTLPEAVLLYTCTPLQPQTREVSAASSYSWVYTLCHHTAGPVLAQGQCPAPQPSVTGHFRGAHVRPGHLADLKQIPSCLMIRCSVQEQTKGGGRQYALPTTIRKL